MASPYLREKGLELHSKLPKQDSPCELFGECGGCTYLDIDYRDELQLKTEALQALLQLYDLAVEVQPTVGSPKSLAYRSKITPQFKKLIDGQLIIGVAPFGKKSLIPLSECPIAMPQIQDKLQKVFDEVRNMDLKKYKRGCLSLRSDGHAFHWGGIGKGSLRQNPDQYFCYSYRNLNIYYSLETFFQVNHDILPLLFELLEKALGIDEQTHFYDLYGGVGLFAFALGQKAGWVTLIELEGASINIAKYNQSQNKVENLDIHSGDVENMLPLPSAPRPLPKKVAMVDPPRAGLKENVIQYLSEVALDKLAYLSCNPETQVRDLKSFIKKGWTIESIQPFDFFPKSYHLESLAILKAPPMPTPSSQGTL